MSWKDTDPKDLEELKGSALDKGSDGDAFTDALRNYLQFANEIPQLEKTDVYLKSCRSCRFLAVHINDVQASIADEPHVTCERKVFTWMEIYEAPYHTCGDQQQSEAGE